MKVISMFIQSLAAPVPVTSRATESYFSTSRV